MLILGLKQKKNSSIGFFIVDYYVGKGIGV